MSDGHQVQVLCEAWPWPIEPPQGDLPAHHRRRRSFSTPSGSLPVRVIVILAASFDGACPNLGSDLRCGIYARRPLVCRIYPAEINPFIKLVPEHKACPAEAWGPGRTPLLRLDRLVDSSMRSLVQQSRDADVSDVSIKQRLCAALGLDAAALANEGFVVHAPQRDVLLEELVRLKREPDRGKDAGAWRFVSNQPATVDSLTRMGAICHLVQGGENASSFTYLGLQPAAALS
jgi:hypothetical protein